MYIFVTKKTRRMRRKIRCLIKNVKKPYLNTEIIENGSWKYKKRKFLPKGRADFQMDINYHIMLVRNICSFYNINSHAAPWPIVSGLPVMELDTAASLLNSVKPAWNFEHTGLVGRIRDSSNRRPARKASRCETREDAKWARRWWRSRSHLSLSVSSQMLIRKDFSGQKLKFKNVYVQPQVKERASLM